ncbi:alpha/beta hydrolase [Rhizobiaceae bacterium n13]|uniref:Alpha/beta hydrolase n=1 Tax=Ferirhizobium litorale TaxID=2927786 RepID=A0AAE3U3N8_9HYPH|nr:alpha/beta hydrolase [Fererhizobium litorale]MDI7864648.1 alpha/beta hydrolase [Fererhizobium litorale]MDI7922139.1 alpha/beta hydrolase [Fererhizobium litorale]
MLRRSLPAIFALALSSSIAWGCGENGPANAAKPEIGYVEIDPDITLRRMVVHSAKPQGTVLLLHGFPETLCAWRDVSFALADDYEVHAIDWPGYGLSSRPAADRFSYAPRDYARILKGYIEAANIDRSRLTIYATDIGALPALLLALDEPDVARTIIVGDFAPFNRPQYMYESLRNLKTEPAASKTRAYMNKTWAEILENAFTRGLPAQAKFDLSAEYREDMASGWSHGKLTSADAFFHYYAHFTRDEDYLEANLDKLKTPVTVIWGEKDIYIDRNLGVEFAERINAELKLLPGIGHYPHLQAPDQTIEEIRASFR